MKNALDDTVKKVEQPLTRNGSISHTIVYLALLCYICILCRLLRRSMILWRIIV